jgi:putative ABC transport system permease protein
VQKLLFIFKLARRSLWRHRLRAVLTIAGIAVAIVSFGLLRTVVDSWYAGAELGSASRLITRNAASLTFQLPVSLVQRVARVEGVKGVSWANWFGGVYVDRKNFFPQFAVDPLSYLALYPEYRLRDEERSAFLRDMRGALAGRQLAEKYGWKVGDVIPIQGTIYPGVWKFVLRGIYDAADSSAEEKQFLFHWDYLNQRVKASFPSLADQVGILVVNVNDPGEAGLVAAAIDSQFSNSLNETRTETQKAYQLGFIAMVDTILVAIQAVAYVVVLIIMAVMANTMAMNARERRSEYATLKALGFQDSFVFGLIFAESLVIALVGGAIGMALTFPLADAFYAATRDMFKLFEVTQTTLLLQAAAAVLVGVVAGVFPALSSSRMRIVDGLRATA